MGWTAPTDRSTGYVVSAVDWNIVEDDLTFLYGDTSWTSVTYTNSWVDFAGGYQTVQFRKVGTRVVLRGTMKSGTLNTASFTLPAGYRPTGNGTLLFSCNSNGAFGQFSITTSGVCTPVLGSNVSFSVDGVTFDTI